MSTRQPPLPGPGNRQLAKMTDMSGTLLRYGGGRLPATKNNGQLEVPSALASIIKVPFKDRVNPLIKPTSQEFVEREKHFLRLLRHDDLTLKQILESSFSEHEVSLMTPASGPPEVVRWQKENALRYNHLLQTTFKGKTPSLQLKITMAYYGLPVAPLKIGNIQTVTERDVNFLEDITAIKPDPLQFLEYFGERCWGKPDRRGKSPCDSFVFLHIVPSI